MNAVPAKSLMEEVALEMGIMPAFVEKDWYVVQVLVLISGLNLAGASVVFTGGTALAKAHRLLKRFSEDIDFRLIDPALAALSTSRQRKRLSGIRESIYTVLSAAFPAGGVKWKSRNSNQFFLFELDYPSVFDRATALRPHVQIEFTVASMLLAPIACQVGSFVTELTGENPELPTITCVDPAENAVDKLSALVWRIPDRVRQPEDNDPDLVRHIHDLAILRPHALCQADFKRLAIETIGRDDDRCKRITGWPLEKKLDLMIGILESDKGYQPEYDRFVGGMSYATAGVPSFNEAMESLKALNSHLLS